MQKLITLLFFILFSFQAYASDYDAFILNFLRVNPQNNFINIEMALGAPTKNNVEQQLRNGQILKFIIDIAISHERTLLPAKEISRYSTEYYLRYDPLTRQYMVINEAKPSIRNTDANYLFKTLISNLNFKIPAMLSKNKHYIMNINVSIRQTTNQPWIQKNLFFLSDSIIQPATFKYEFDY